MKPLWRRTVIWGIVGAAVIAGLGYAFRPQPVPVDLITLAPGPLVVSIDEEASTRIRDVFVISAPVTGRALRIEAEVGDPVVAGESVIAEIEPIDPTLLDPRSEAQARADLNAAESAMALARAEVAQAEAELEFARTERERARRLIREQTISQREADDIERNYKTRRAALETAAARLQVRSFELERARAQLMPPAESRARRELCECVPIFSPVDGSILHVVHESEGVVPAGTPLVEVGEPTDLEIVVDLLSSDAVRVAPGQRVIIEEWGGEPALAGRVRRVDPVGFTKISALGIEEQRVNVVIDFESPREEWSRLGHGYQLDVRIVLWESGEVLRVPLTALFRDGDAWAVFVAEDGRARGRSVRLGRRTGLAAQVLEGLRAGDRVVAHPSDRIAEGVRIVAR